MIKFLIYIVFSLLSFGVYAQISRIETFYKNESDWRIIAENSATGLKWYFNPDMIWKKDSLFTCKIKMSIKGSEKKALKQILTGKVQLTDSAKNKYKSYDYSIYYLVVNCINESMRVYGLSNIEVGDNQIEFIEFPNSRLIPLPQEVEKTIESNVCNRVKSILFDKSAVSPF